MTRLNHFKTRPKVEPINTSNYLKRISLKEESPSINYLKKIHKAHLLSIPFENFDLYFGKKMDLNIDRIYNKIVHQNRGGISLELNILLYHLLEGLGYQCKLTTAQNWINDSWAPPFFHPIVIIESNEKCLLADVGSIDLFFEPLEITPDKVQLSYNKYFRIEKDPDGWLILQSSSDHTTFSKHYRFRTKNIEIIQFLDAFNHLQNDAFSSLSQEKIISQCFPEGRITLKDRQLISNLKGENEEIPILHEDDFATKLEEHFGIDYQQLVLQRLNK